MTKGNMKNIAQTIQDGIDKIYNNTYLSSANNSKDLNTIKYNIDKSIDDIMSTTKDTIGLSNISRIYSRTEKETADSNNKLEEVMNDSVLSDSIMSTFTNNKSFIDYDNDIDIIRKFMPKVKSAFELKKDHVLCADSFSKDFIKPMNKSNIKETSQFNTRCEAIKKKYNLIELFDEIYNNTSVYGEQFIYIKPYSEAFNKLIDIKENCMIDVPFKEEDNNINLNVQFDTSGVLQSAMKSQSTLIKVVTEAAGNGSKIVPDNMEFEGLEKQSSDGLIDINKVKSTNTKVDVPGCIVKKLKRENIIVIFIDNVCIGYYYIECEFDDFIKQSSSKMFSNRISDINQMNNKQNTDNILKKLCNDLSGKIDSTFINANQDLRQELYMILNNNQLLSGKNSGNSLKVTFIPPDDMIHMYFNKDQNTNRGLSDLDNGMVTAKLRIAMGMNNAIGVLTRSQDKRIYYVKNHIDTNISKTLLNTVNQLKRSNFGTREVMNIKNFLNVQGQFNDLLVPMGPSGEAPINFEMMQGQDIDMKMDFLNTLEEDTIESMDIPYEFVNSTSQVDFALRLTMHNGKLLKIVLKRQSKTEPFFSKIFTKLYNYEYNENDIIDINLPAPNYIDSINSKALIDGLNDLSDGIVAMETNEAENTELDVMLFKSKIMKHYLSSYVDMELIDRLKEESKIEANIISKEE